MRNISWVDTRIAADDVTDRPSTSHRASNAVLLPEIAKSDLIFYENLGGGTYGSVFRARWVSANRDVAVKKLFILEAEARMLSMVRHKNIVQFYGVCSSPPDYCIVTGG